MRGDWVCLKNLHLVTPWLPTLEKVLKSLEPHPNFRCWLTTEPHPKFPHILLESSLKVTHEPPPGVKKNLQRTLEGWSEGFFGKMDLVTPKGALLAHPSACLLRSQILFLSAHFHAVLQVGH